MKVFFHGWKRTVQLATIILALVLIGGFMKHQTFEDTIMFRVLVPLNLLSVSLLLIK